MDTIAKIAAAAKSAGMSERGLSAAAGLHPTTIAVARRSGVLSPDALAAIAKVLELDPAALAADPAPDAPASDAPAPADPAPANGVRVISILRLRTSPLNPRKSFDAVAIRELADSIAAQGLLQNLVVRQPGPAELYDVVAGERRYRAIELLYRENRLPEDLRDGIPCRVVAAGEAEHVALALVENLQRQDVNPMDEAEALARLHALDPKAWSTENIARAIGCSQRFVQQRLQLVNRLAPEAQQALRTGTLTVEHARALVVAPKLAQQTALAGARTLTAAALASQMRSGWTRADWAIFAWEPDDAPFLTEDDDGTRWYTGAQHLFRSRQEAAFPAYLDQLRQRFATVDQTNHIPVEASRVQDPAACLVKPPRWDGKVELLEGWRRPRDQLGDHNDQVLAHRDALRERRRGIEADIRAERKEACAALLAAIGPRLDMSDCYALELYREATDFNDGLPPALIAKAPALAHFFDADGGYDLETGGSGAFWIALIGLGHGTLMLLFRDLMASRTADSGTWGEFDPAYLEIAERRGVAIAPSILWTELGIAAEAARRAAAPDQAAAE